MKQAVILLQLGLSPVDVPSFDWLCLCAQPSLSDSEDLEEMERLRKEHIEALREIKRLQVRKTSRLSLC